MLFSFPFFLWILIFQLRKKNRISLKGDHLFSIILLGIVGYYLASLFDFIGLQYISAGIGRLILFLYPTLTLLIAFLFLKLQIKLKELVALVLSYLGIVLVCINDNEANSTNFFLGTFLVFLSALCFAIYLTGGVNHIKRIGSNYYISIAMSVSSVMVVIHFLITRELSNLIQPLEVYFFSFTIAIFSTVLPVFFMSAAIHKIGVIQTTMLSTI